MRRERMLSQVSSGISWDQSFEVGTSRGDSFAAVHSSLTSHLTSEAAGAAFIDVRVVGGGEDCHRNSIAFCSSSSLSSLAL